MLAAVVDTCAVYSGLVRDFTFTLAACRCYRLVLSEDILIEYEEVEVRKLMARGHAVDDARDRAERLVGHLRGAFDLVEDERVDLVADVGLPDPDDEHLVKAAVAGGAEVIVTANERHFPASALPPGVRAQRPRSFLLDMVTADPRLAVDALREMSRRRKVPPQSPRDIIDLLLMKEGITGEAADYLRGALEHFGDPPPTAPSGS